MVTNADQEQYVEDYFFLSRLTNLLSTNTAISRKGSIPASIDRRYPCTPQERSKRSLKGTLIFDIFGLKAATQYEDDFDETSATIQDFWQIVRNSAPINIVGCLNLSLPVVGCLSMVLAAFNSLSNGMAVATIDCQPA